MTANASADVDVVVVGSGFGGSVAALRLVEKGYSVAVVEAGRRFRPKELPTSSWDVRNFLWAPALGCTGIQRISLLRNVVVLSGAGVGGGSLVYANTLYRPLEDFYRDPQWRHITDWQAELAPYYDQAERMLGVTVDRRSTPSDAVMAAVATRMGVAATFRPAPIGVYLGRAGEEVDDPYFGGRGPRRTGCLRCGECMTGCRHGAKNTLGTNYLYLAEHMGARILERSTVTSVSPRDDGGFEVEMRRTPSGPASFVNDRLRPDRSRRRITAHHVVLAAGTLGTQRLLHRLRDDGTLSRVSRRLGELTRTNSEALLGAIARDGRVDFSVGQAITSSIHPDETTHIEPVRYGKGSNAMGLLGTVLVDGGGRVPRPVRFLGVAARHPATFLRSFSVRHWSERTVILLVMQSLDNSLTVFRRQGWLRDRLTSRQGHGAPNPTWIPAGHTAARLAAEEIGGVPGGTIGDIVDVPMTAHILGGCVIGDSAETGVVDAYHRLHGHPGLHVVDGSSVSANLGVNPSLTITAQAERAMAMWPNKGEPDPRPPLGAPYRRIDPVPPRWPAVPAHAPAALRVSPQTRPPVSRPG
ncbi:MAG TPA: GMC family oxidoreductase [Jiangellaceae bacterium]|jgi:cholesterol oxidase|nr:GMC family oxidoreductase [Jiangellaceae bacterium]